jgi:uncharacterized protein Yka (UPF0111/DUF47 family)
MTRLEKLETLVKIEEGIQSFTSRIELCQETIETSGTYFREIRDKNTDKIHTYMMCIKRLHDRFYKIVFTL